MDQDHPWNQYAQIEMSRKRARGRVSMQAHVMRYCVAYEDGLTPIEYAEENGLHLRRFMRALLDHRARA